MYAIGAGGHVRVCAASASIIARHTDDTTRTEIVTDGVDGSAVLRGLTAAGWWRLEGTDVASARVWVRPADPCAAASGIVGGALASPHQRGALVIIQLRLTDQFGNSCTDACMMRRLVLKSWQMPLAIKPAQTSRHATCHSTPDTNIDPQR